MNFNAANVLTSMRLVLTPFFLFAFVADRKEIALIIFCVAGFTDLIDGSVARLLNQPSKQGALLDPIADKFLMQSCFISLAVAGFLPIWFLLLAFCRDTMIIIGIIYLERIKAKLPYRPTWVSKFATLFQLAVAIFGLLRWWRPEFEFFGFSIVTWQVWTMFIAAFLIAVSGTQYVSLGVDILRNHNNGSDEDVKL